MASKMLLAALLGALFSERQISSYTEDKELAAATQLHNHPSYKSTPTLVLVLHVSQYLRLQSTWSDHH